MKHYGMGARRTAGFTLLEITIALLIAGMMLSVGLLATQVKMRESRGVIHADLLSSYSAGLDQYMTTYFSSIVGAGAVAGVADKMAPTIDELKALNLVSASVSSTPLIGGVYQSSVTCNPAPCVATSKLGGLVWTSIAVVNPSTGNVDGAALNAAMAKIGGDAGASEIATPALLTWGSGGTSANPAGAVAGILAIRSGDGSAQFNQFLRRDGSLPMTGNLNMGGTQLTNLGTQVVNNACATNGALASDATGKVLSCVAGAWKNQGSAYWEDPVASYAALPACTAAIAWQTRVVQTPTVGAGPRAYTCSGATLTWKALAVDDAGNLTVPGSAAVNGVVAAGVSAATSTVGAACASGTVAQTTAGVILYCDTNTSTYRAASAGEVVANTIQVAGVFVEGAACPNGTADNGRVSRDSTGLILSCQSGVWKSAASGLGYGQTWQSLACCRALAANYTNATSKPISVMVATDMLQYHNLYAYVGGVLAAWTHMGSPVGYTAEPSITFIVPPGAIYSVRSSYAATVIYWQELR